MCCWKSGQIWEQIIECGAEGVPSILQYMKPRVIAAVKGCEVSLSARSFWLYINKCAENTCQSMTYYQVDGLCCGCHQLLKLPVGEDAGRSVLPSTWTPHAPAGWDAVRWSSEEMPQVILVSELKSLSLLIFTLTALLCDNIFPYKRQEQVQYHCAFCCALICINEDIASLSVIVTSRSCIYIIWLCRACAVHAECSPKTFGYWRSLRQSMWNEIHLSQELAIQPFSF